jgi:ABC-type branched-subunit amino acid transport system substrate-binding protein
MPSAFRLVAILGLLVLLAWGCAPRQTIKSADLLATPNLLVEADAAWQAKSWEAAELYYAALLERRDLVRSELPTVYGRLADAASRNGHYHQARIALESWANLDGKAVELKAWEHTYLDTMAALNKTERLQNHLKWLLSAVTVPWETRSDAALWYGEYFRSRGDFERSLDVLAGFYVQAPGSNEKAAMEQAYAQTLKGLDMARVDGVSTAVTVENQWRYPYVLVGFERGVREASDRETWSTVWRTMRNLAAKAELVDRAPLEKTLAELEARYGVPRVGLALALPLTGPYGKVGVKILRGAGLAQWRLAQDGVDVDLRVINTEAPGWRKRLDELPGNYSVAGGPLRVQAFKEMNEGVAPGKRIIDKRAVFTFLASLGELKEGKDAWRFFSSRDDEVHSLVRLAVDELKIKDLAVFYPEEKFGRAMAETFYREAAPLGGRIRGMQSYPSKDLKQWGKRVGKLLKVPADFSENKDVPLQQPDFGAVFIPDGWGQAQTLLPNFFFYEGDQLLFLGPSLWSQALDNAKDIDEHYYRLAVCPGAWWEDSDGGRALQAALTDEGLGQADYWVALGYDFLRFAGRFGTLPEGWTADDVNERIATAKNIDFSMAPMTWDSRGVASQDLFLFSPVRNGKRLVNAEWLADRIARAKARRERRVDAYEQRRDEKNARQESSVF